jgi:serine/threonine-protein kinase
MLENDELTALDRITMRALALEPDHRYASAKDMALDLERAIVLAPRQEVGVWVSAAARDLLASRAAAALEMQASDTIDHTTHQATTELTREPGLVAGEPPNVIGRMLANGKLEIEARVGTGAYGNVYRARHRDLRTALVAVKILHDGVQRDLAYTKKFHAEALAASRTEHRNLVRVIDFGQEPDGLLYLSMELLEGVTVRELLRREKLLPMQRALEIMLQVCAGLSHAHSCGIVHRDIKPSNVMLVSRVDDDGHEIEVVKVCDFGIAVQRGPDVPAAARVAGTPEYMSPEQCRGADVDGRSDVYSCGVMLYQLVTGRVPFRARTRAAMKELHYAAAPPPPSTYLPDIDPRLEKIILRALAKDPANRPATMIELRAALKELLGAQPAREREPVAKREAPTTLELVALANELAAAPRQRMNAIAILRASDEEFARECMHLEAAIPLLASRCEAGALGVITGVMSAIRDEATSQASKAASHARRVLRTISDPSTLARLAEKMLTAREEPSSDAIMLLGWAQASGAHALYTARAKHDSPPARTRFVFAMRAIGPPALPVMRTALQHLLPNVDSRANATLALDLMRAIPHGADEETATIVLRYTRAPDAELSREATMTLAKLR